jgi:uncharacterized membrane protein
MPASAAFCPGCGRLMEKPRSALGKVGFLPENVAGAIAYLSFLPAIVFLTLDPFRRSVFTRFHSVQCLLVWLAVLGLAGAIRLLAFLLLIIPLIGPLLLWLLAACSALALFFLWLVLVVKAFQGETFKLPVLGDIAEHYATPRGSAF